MRRTHPRTVPCVSMVHRAFWQGLLPCLAMMSILVGLFPVVRGAAAPARQQGPRVQVDEWELTSVNDWQRGAVNGLLISNNAGGELRLDANQSQGGFVSSPFSTTFTLNALGAVWRADLPTGTDLRLEIRGRSTPPEGDILSDAGWSVWYPLIAGDARSQADDGAFATPDVLEFPPDTSHLQVRASFTSSIPNASAVLSQVTIVYLNTLEGPPTSPGLPRTPIVAGPETLTPPPAMVSRPTWSARPVTTRPTRSGPRGIIVHQIDVTPGESDTLPLLRALTAYQVQVLGWDDLSYHYFIDENGTLYEGRFGGPTSVVPRLSAGDIAVHVALIGNRDDAPSAAAQQTLTNLLAWLGEAYALPPTGQHTVLVGGNVAARPNIVGHAEVVAEAPDPGPPVRELLPGLRTQVDQATVRSRWYFVEGNVQDYTQRLALFNTSAFSTEARVVLFPPDSAPVIETVALLPGGRQDVALNDVITATTSLPLMVEASEAIIAQQTMATETDLHVGTGSSQASRVWYFAEGSTETGFQTFLLLYNPQDTPTEAAITYMRSDGSQAQQTLLLPASQRVGINVGDVLADAGFGMQVVATQPIVAERTMRFGEGGSGLHNSPGIPELSREWFFAEGTTQAPFAMRLLLLNPNEQPAEVLVTFMTPDGTSLTRRYAIPGTTRLLVNVNEVVPDLGVATLVQSDRPVAAERAIYFPRIGASVSPTTPEGVALAQPLVPLVGTVSVGATAPAFSWRFADAPTADTNQYLLISNPRRVPARVTVELLLPDGSRPQETLLMPAGSRFTLPVHEIYPGQPGVAALVRSTQPVVAERSLYPTAGQSAGGGAVMLGVPGD